MYKNSVSSHELLEVRHACSRPQNRSCFCRVIFFNSNLCVVFLSCKAATSCDTRVKLSLENCRSTEPKLEFVPVILTNFPAIVADVQFCRDLYVLQCYLSFEFVRINDLNG